MRVATESTDVFDFARNLRQEVKSTFKFTDEVLDQFMSNQFGMKVVDNEIQIGNLIPFYELYKKQEKIEAFQISFTSIN